jgi:hypothetical protein
MDTRLLNFRNLIRFFTKGDTKELVNEYNDLFCLFLSQLVYFSNEFILKHLNELGSTEAVLVSYGGPKAVCIHLDGTTYVSIKGLSSRNRSEWSVVLNFLTETFGTARGHRGFVRKSKQLLPHIESFVARFPGKVVLTGHSMGGAIATLTSIPVDGCKVVTFGSPNMVLAKTLGAFSEKDVTHYRIDTDFVTHLPPMMYRRPGKEVVKRHKLSLIKFWDSHKLYIYYTYMIPVIAGVFAASQISKASIDNNP